LYNRAVQSFADDVRRGLTAPRKFLLPQYFYDALGSALFDAICELPEYYVTRCETEILTSRRAEIAQEFGTDVRLVELGAGSARKTRILLDAVRAAEYVPVDVDAGMLEKTAGLLRHEYPRLAVHPICADFRQPPIPPSPLRTIVLFLGSTIGNLDPEAATAMLRSIRALLQPGDALFLGADLRKPVSVLIPAYDDALGVTAAFNLNLLARINRELGGHFDLAQFQHYALYDEVLGRIEMHLISRIAQRVAIDALSLEVSFAEGETIHTESSHKYDDDALRALMEASGFAIARQWTDSRGWFTDALCVVERRASSPVAS
jgi:dimethylhistidine N-methyltransferase